MKRKQGIYEKYVKRLIDIVCSFVAIVVLSPILLILTVAGTFKMKGNPFFIQKRPGKIDVKTGEEKIIHLYKFRSMTNEKDKEGKLLPDAQRLNKYGTFLRSTSLDELPSLFNILKGDLSIVGPRPLAVSYLQYYTEEERRRHTVSPGLTGLAQVNGRNNLSWEEKFAYDIKYVDNITFLNDVKIILKTVRKVFKREDIGQGEQRPVSLSVLRKKQ